MSRTAAAMTDGKDQVRFSQSEISVAGLGAGEKNNCVPLKDGRDIAAPKIAGGGADRTIGFAPSKLDVGGGLHLFFGFPGHDTIMFGELALEQVT